MFLDKIQLLKALSLTERIDYLKQQPDWAQSVSQPYTPLDDTVPEKLKKWQSQATPVASKRFLSTLEHLGITETQFQLLLDAPERWASNQPGNFPPWLDKMAARYDSFPWETHSYLSDVFKKTIPTSVFFDCAEPLIHDGRERLMKKIKREIKHINQAPFKLEELEYRLYSVLVLHCSIS
jgi:hypothetical protein